ncbi:MAG TPA: flagellar basal body-associated FliL family protein [Devosiaceae bacterium]
MSDADVTEFEDEDVEAAAEKPAGKSRKWLFVGAGVALVLLAGGAAGYFVLLKPADTATDAKLAEVKPSFFYDLPTITVNLANEGNGEQFLKLDISLELANKDMVALIEPRMAKVLDAFQVYLRELRRSDLEGSAGIYRLKDELRRRVNLAVYPAEVQSILFKQILVQ